jgi:hypothetical protein
MFALLVLLLWLTAAACVHAASFTPLTDVNQLVNPTMRSFSVSSTLTIDLGDIKAGHLQLGHATESTLIQCNSSADPCFLIINSVSNPNASLALRNFNLDVLVAPTTTVPIIFSVNAVNAISSIAFSDITVANASRSRFVHVNRVLDNLALVDIRIDSIARLVSFTASGAVRSLHVSRANVSATEDLFSPAASLHARVASIDNSVFELTSKFDVFNTVVNDTSSRFAAVTITALRVTGGEFQLDWIDNLTLSDITAIGTSFRIRNCALAVVFHSSFATNGVAGSVFRIDSTTMSSFGVSNFTLTQTDTSKVNSEFIVVNQGARFDKIVVANFPAIDTFRSVIAFEQNVATNVLILSNLTVLNRTQLVTTAGNVNFLHLALVTTTLRGTFDRPALALINPTNVVVNHVDVNAGRFAGPVFSFTSNLTNVTLSNVVFRNGAFDTLVRLVESSGTLVLLDIGIFSADVDQLVTSGTSPVAIDGLIVYNSSVRSDLINATLSGNASFARMAVVDCKVDGHLLVGGLGDVRELKTLLITNTVFNDSVLDLRDSAPRDASLLVDGMAFHNVVVNRAGASLLLLNGSAESLTLRNIEVNLTACDGIALLVTVESEMLIESISSTNHRGVGVLGVQLCKNAVISNISIADTRGAIAIGQFGNVIMSDIVIQRIVSSGQAACVDLDRAPVIFYDGESITMTRVDFVSNSYACPKIMGLDDAAGALWMTAVARVRLSHLRVISNSGVAPAVTCLTCASVRVEDSWFEGNSGQRGGGALSVGTLERIAPPSSLILNCTFLNNRASHAAAVALVGGRVSIEKSRFLDNHATNTDIQSAAGGVLVTLLSDVTIVEARFDNNSANRAGCAGLVFWESNVTMRSVDIIGSRIDSPGQASFATTMMIGTEFMRPRPDLVNVLANVSITGIAMSGSMLPGTVILTNTTFLDSCLCGSSGVDLSCDIASRMNGNLKLGTVATNCVGVGVLAGSCNVSCPLRALSLGFSRPKPPAALRLGTPFIDLPSLPRFTSEYLLGSTTTQLMPTVPSTRGSVMTASTTSSSPSPSSSSIVSSSTSSVTVVSDSPTTSVRNVSDSSTDTAGLGNSAAPELDIALIAGAAGGGGAALLLLIGLIVGCVVCRRKQGGKDQAPEMVSASSTRSEPSEYTRIPTAVSGGGLDNYDIGNIKHAGAADSSAASLMTGGSTEMRSVFSVSVSNASE